MLAVTTQVQKQIVRLRLSDPEARNAIGFTMAAKLQEELAKISEMCDQKPIACVIIEAHAFEGKSQKIWLSGGNLKDLHTHRQNSDATLNFFKTVNDCTQMLIDMPVPVIMQQNGWALGGGAEFVLASDLRFATKDSGLDFKQLKIGLPTGFGGTRRLVHLVGLSSAQKILLTSETLEASDAKKVGIIHEVFGTEKKLTRHVDELAKHLSSLNPESLRAQKAMFRMGSKSEFEIFKAQLSNETFLDFLVKFSK